MKIIKVNEVEIPFVEDDGKTYMSLTKMTVGFEGGSRLIEKWLSSKNTVEILGYWEGLNNPNFNSPEFGGILSEAGTNRFTLSVKQWTEKTNAIGIRARSGQQGGTYAHIDLALEFGGWLNPLFRLLINKEFQRLKELEQARLNTGWDIRRLISKANYKIQTEAIASVLIPSLNTQKEKDFAYMEEADLLNLALFGMTAKQWRTANPDLVAQNLNIRDLADTYRLIILSNLESINAEMIHQGITKQNRFKTLVTVSASQLKALMKSTAAETLNARSPNLKTGMGNISAEDFTKNLKGLLNTPPPPKKDK